MLRLAIAACRWGGCCCSDCFSQCLQKTCQCKIGYPFLVLALTEFQAIGSSFERNTVQFSVQVCVHQITYCRSSFSTTGKLVPDTLPHECLAGRGRHPKGEGSGGGAQEPQRGGNAASHALAGGSAAPSERLTASDTCPTCLLGASLPVLSELSGEDESGYAGALSGALHGSQTPDRQEAGSAALSSGQDHLPASQPVGAAGSRCRSRAFCRGDQHQWQGRLQVVLLQEGAAGVGECHCLLARCMWASWPALLQLL